MATNRVQQGKRITFDPGATVSSGDPVVVGNLLVVCMTDGVDGTEIEGAIEEVYDLPKLDAAVIAIGEPVDFDLSGGVIDDSAMTSAAGDLENCGIAMETLGATTGASIKVKLNAAGLSTIGT